MAEREMEAPPGQDPVWDELYTSRGDEVMFHRPIYTGDVFADVELRPTRGESKRRVCMVVQHPCAMRPDGVHLADSILVARVRQLSVLPRSRWAESGKLMPLPALQPQFSSSKANHAALFDETYHVHPDDLALQSRIACLSEVGTYLLLQRWVFHSSRVIPSVRDFEAMNQHVFAEVELLDTWCEAAAEAGVPLEDALSHVNAWLDEPGVDGATRRKTLRDPGGRSSLTRGVKTETRRRYRLDASVVPFRLPRAEPG